jgi:hypothetical protein
VVDTLALDWGWPYTSDYEPNDFAKEEMDKVRFLTLNESESFYESFGYECYEEWLAFVLRFFPRVEKVTLSGNDRLHRLLDITELVFRRPSREEHRILWRFKRYTIRMFSNL